MAWFGHPRHRGTVTKAMTAVELIDQRLITLPANSPLNKMMLRWFEASNQPIPPVSICNSLAMVLRLTNSGHGWSILPVCFALSNESRVLPVPIRVVPDLPMLKLCSAYQTEGTVDTLAPIVEIAKDITMRKPGFNSLG